MADFVDALIDEHRRQHRLLERLETLGREPASDATQAVMRNVMQYMRRYPDVHHHPIEDRVFDRVAERDAALAPAVERLHAEHGTLARAGEHLLELLRLDAGHGCEAGGATLTPLAGAVADYAALLRAHHRVEEEDVFPAARRLLTVGDWEAIEADARGRFDDPLAGARVDAEFGALYAILTASA